MYNGIGLQTPRGSGTNGYVQRNMSFVQKSREKVSYKTEEDIKKLDALANKKPNQGILAHERKRMIELKCLEMQELMEDQGYADDEIESKVALFRKMLMDKEKLGEKEIPKDDYGRPIVKESHQIAEANQEKNSKMREALGISQYFVEGSSLDPERKAKEAAAEEAKKKYTLVPDSSSSSSPERSNGKEKDQKRKKKKSHSYHEKMEISPKKKTNIKKHKKERSFSPEVQKKKKSKKPAKFKHKSKNDSSRRKCERSSSSSSSSSSDSADEESSSGSSSRDSDSDSSRDKHKNSSKQEKVHKLNRKRSTSSERIRYSKDARSRKDIYEAKKAKYKRKSTHTSSSSSSDDSSPKQYYRLEPVLLKSKCKHKKSHQIIEIPKKRTFELKKYDKKKRDSSSSEEGVTKPESKRRKRSGSSYRTLKHHFERVEAKIHSKAGDGDRSYKRPEKDYSSSNKQRHNRSQSDGSHHKGKFSEDESDNCHRKPKEKSKDNSNKRHQEKESKTKKHKKSTESPKQHNGHSKHSHRSFTREPEDSEMSEMSESHEKCSPRSTSYSPVVFKNKKHIIETPPAENTSKKKFVLESSPKKAHSKSDKLSVECHSAKHSNTRSKSNSPTEPETRKSSKNLKTLNKVSPRKKRHDSKSIISSSSQHKSSKTKYKQRSNYLDRSLSESMHSDQSDCQNLYNENTIRNRKSCQVVKETTYKSRSRSPVHYKSNSGSSKRTPGHSEKSFPCQDKTSSSKNRENLAILSEIITKKSPIVNQQNREASSSRSSTRSPSRRQKKQKKNKEAIKHSSKSSPVWSCDEAPSPKYDKCKSQFTKCNTNLEVKSKQSSSDEAPDSSIPISMHRNHDDESFFNNKKSNWNVVSVEDSTFQNADSKSVFIEKSTSPSKKEIKAVSKSVKGSSSKQHAVLEDKRNSPSDSRPAIGNADQEKNRERVIEDSRSRSRSTSAAHSASGSERSSRSRSYSRRTKSYSKSRSQSYSKSRSRSKSRSKSRSRTPSKSYSRSRSISVYSRSRSRTYSSRSRSRSIARSPSIPRRRGSPSFLDKRRITRARSVSMPRYRRASRSSSRSSSSRSPFSRHSSISTSSSSLWSRVYTIKN